MPASARNGPPHAAWFLEMARMVLIYNPANSIHYAVFLNHPRASVDRFDNAGFRQGSGERQLSAVQRRASAFPPPSCAPCVIATAAWRRGVGMRGPVGTRHRMRPAETEDRVHQGSGTAVPHSAQGRSGVQTARMCHRIAACWPWWQRAVRCCFAVVESACCPERKLGDEDTRSQAAATSRPLGPSSRQFR